jgi:imidazole glycerol-phosphate synthase subunit HisF
MFRPRCIVVLLLKSRGLVKTKRFQSPTYIGDPINAVRIFNQKYVDELMFLDIQAEKNGIQYGLLEEIIQESIMPFSYGGGLKTFNDVREVFDMGIEKVVFCSHVIDNPDMIKQTARNYGTQSVSICVNINKRNQVIVAGRVIKMSPVEYSKYAYGLGAGEIIVQSIENDGCMEGYDLSTVREVSDVIPCQVVALGGAGSLLDMKKGILDGRASAVAAGSMFVFYGPFKSVLINYPTREELNEYFRGILP